ncbi:MAG: ABC transporter permease [Chloroflexota bacterium]|nr:ABC transporter permease [Chloroflexota bacterium]
MLVTARLVLVEAARRRLILAVIGLTLLAVVLTGWGFARIPSVGTVPLTPDQITLVAAQLTILVAFMFSFVLALSAVFVAAPAISGEAESGIALAVLARPISRLEYVAGKWIGLAILLLVYAAGSIACELVVIRLAIGYAPPSPPVAVLFLYAESLVLLTLGLALSTRLSGMVGGVVALVLFGMTWIAGIVGGVGEILGNDTLVRVGTIVKLILPTDGLWRGAVHALEPGSFFIAARLAGPAAAANPFYAPAPPAAAFDVWAVAWIVVVFAAATWSFRAREV